MPITTPNVIPRRIVEVVVGPPGGQGKRFRGLVDGRPGLWITARAEHTSGNRPNKGKFVIHNLSIANATFVERRGNVLQVFAGITVPGLFFRGDISRVETRQEGPTRETIIEAAEGQRLWREGAIDRSWPKNTTRTQVLADLLKAWGLTAGYISPRLPEKRFASGLVWSNSNAGLADLLFDSEKGERWSIQGTTFDVVAAGETKPGTVPLLTADSGLIGVPRRTKGGGVKFKSIFNARIRPGNGIQVGSQLGFGLYRVSRVTHEVDSRGLVWQSEGEAVRP